MYGKFSFSNLAPGPLLVEYVFHFMPLSCLKYVDVVRERPYMYSRAKVKGL